MKETRKTTVKFMTSVKYPVLRISGKWLIEAGFDFGTEVEIKVYDGLLIITALR